MAHPPPGAAQRFAQGPARAAVRPPDPPPVWAAEGRALRAHEAALAEAEAAARGADSLEALVAAIHGFEGCELKLTAKNTVVARGNPQAPVMLIGEAPGRDEDLQGQPFVGAGGQLLDAMLRAAGFDPARDVYITNCVFWRPPGNRTPSDGEIQLCQPFTERHVELIAPRYLGLIGGVSAKALLAESRGITKLRGHWFGYQHAGLPAPLPAMPLFHPAYLLRQPAQKRRVWRDLLALRAVVEAGADPLVAT
jgi:DNA polymerase